VGREGFAAAAAYRAGAGDEVDGVAGRHVDAEVVDDRRIDLRGEIGGVLQALESLRCRGDGQLLEGDRDFRRGEQNERGERDENRPDEDDGDLAAERKL